MQVVFRRYSLVELDRAEVPCPIETGMMLKYFWPVIDDDVRGSRRWRCPYCNQIRGGEHLPGCLIRQRTVVIEVDNEIELVAWFPESWPLDMVVSYYQDGFVLDLAVVCPGLKDRQPASHSMVVTNVREATVEDEETLPEWPQ